MNMHTLGMQYQALDPFVIYGDQYKAVRKSIAELMYTNQADSFESEMEVEYYYSFIFSHHILCK